MAAVEHADGTASCVQLADGSYRLLEGLGSGAVLESKCVYRVTECMSMVKVLESLNEGKLSEFSLCLYIAYTALPCTCLTPLHACCKACARQSCVSVVPLVEGMVTILAAVINHIASWHCSHPTQIRCTLHAEGPVCVSHHSRLHPCRPAAAWHQLLRRRCLLHQLEGHSGHGAAGGGWAQLRRRYSSPGCSGAWDVQVWHRAGPLVVSTWQREGQLLGLSAACDAWVLVVLRGCCWHPTPHAWC